MMTNVEMTRFKYRVDLIKEIHVTDKGGTKIVTRETDWDDIVAERL
jgi:alanine-alpha-ketoisovalerate/valine-pyruvate aminotransferase